MVIVWHITSNAIRLVQLHLHQSPSTLRRLNPSVCPIWFYAIYCVLCRSPQLLFALCYFVRSDLEWQYYDWWSIRLKYSGSTISNYIFFLVLNLFILIQFFLIHVSLKSLYLITLHFRYVSFTYILYKLFHPLAMVTRTGELSFVTMESWTSTVFCGPMRQFLH